MPYLDDGQQAEAAQELIMTFYEQYKDLVDELAEDEIEQDPEGYGRIAEMLRGEAQFKHRRLYGREL